MPLSTSKNSKISSRTHLHQKEFDFNDNRYKSSVLPLSNHRLKLLLKYTGSNKKVLDLGCGTGFFLKLLLSKHPHVWGVDASKQALAKAAKIPNTTVSVANVEHYLPFPKDHFEIVTAGEIIEHLYDTNAFLQEIKRVLKKDGLLVLSTPNVASLGRRLLLLCGLNPLLETELSPSAAGHLRYFTRDSLFQLLKKNGFTIINSTSDMVNFVNRLEKFNSKFLAKLFPSIGGTIIVQARVSKK